jgi:GNAT superfamily N-acetyltransferase
MTRNEAVPHKGDVFILTSPDDERAAQLIQSLAAHYEDLYGEEFGEAATGEISRYPAWRFAPPDGAFILLQRDGLTICGGGFKRRDEQTAEIKRVWTHPDHLRQGLARRLLARLENQASRQGYSRLYLTTGYLQTPAMQLYRNAGYRPLFDSSVDPRVYGLMPFEKDIEPDRAGGADQSAEGL